MGILRTQAVKLVERLLGCEVERLSTRSYAIFDRQHRKTAWFSYQAQLQSVLEGAHIDLVIDVGANEGQFARGLRRFYRGEIMSFEPVSSVFEKLAATASADPLWQVHKLALGSEEDETQVEAFYGDIRLLSALP